MTHEAQTRLPWTAEEDAILISLVERYGEKRWNMVANGLPGRTGKGCSHRWRTYLRPDVKHPHLEPFTEWEAAVIVQAQKEMGNNWLAIAKLLLPGRSNTAVKNFWHCRLKSGSGTNTNRFIVEGYSLRYLLSEVPHEERIHPVALPAFPSTAPTGQLHHHHKQEQHMVDLHQLAHNSAMLSAAGHDPLTAQAYSAACLDPSAVDMTGASMMGLNPAAAGLPAGLNPGSAPPPGVPPPDPSLDPKEDLKRRASAYVQQQLAMFGQPASRNGGSSSSRRDSIAHTGSQGRLVSNTGYMGVSSGGWGGGSESFSMDGVGHNMLGPNVSGYKKGSGRGRGRRPGQRNRYSSDDDPNDETYVPSGRYGKEEQMASRDDVTTRHSDPSAGGSSIMTHAYMHAGGVGSMGHGMATSSAVAMSQQMLSQGMDYQYHSMQQQHYEIDHAAAAAMVHHHISDGGCVTSGHYQQQQQLGPVDNIAAATAELGNMPWQETELGYHLQTMPGSQAAAAAADAAGSNHSTFQPAIPPAPAAAATTASEHLCQVTSAAVAAAAAACRPSLLGLEETAVAYEAFRQSGGDFKMSISCLDELLSGAPGPNTAPGDWNALNGVAGLFRGTSLDGSRFSLTGSAGEAAAGLAHDPRRRSSRGGAFDAAMQQQQQPQPGTEQAGAEQQQPGHCEMPPPEDNDGVVAQRSKLKGLDLSDYHTQSETAEGVTAGPVGTKSVAADVTGSPSKAHTSVTGGPSQSGAAAAPVVTHGPSQIGTTQGPSRPGVTQGPIPDSARCESPFKAAAHTEPPFSPPMKEGAAAAAAATAAGGFNSSHTAPSSQPTQCSAGQVASHLQLGSYSAVSHAINSTHHQQFSSSTAQPAAPAVAAGGLKGQQAAPGLPATFHNVLQALGGSSKPMPAPAPASAAHFNHPAADLKSQPGAAAAANAAVKPAVASGVRIQGGLHLQCLGDALHRRSRASYGLLSPAGNIPNIFADATEGCLTLDDAIGGIYSTHHCTEDNPQARAERKSLRVLLGMLANTADGSSNPDQHDPLTWTRPAAATAAAVDPDALTAADDLTFMRRSSHGGCLAGSSYLSRPGGSSSGRPSLSVLPPLSRPSQHGFAASTGVLGLGDCHKRPRGSLTLTSPMGGAAKRQRVSFAGGVAGRVSSGTAEYDDCLSYWQN